MRELVVSPVAEKRIAAAKAFTERFRPATEMIVIASSRGAADDFVRRLVASGRALFGVHRFSLMQFASRLGRHALAADGKVAISRLAQEAMTASTVFETVSAGELAYFAPVAAFPGFARSAARTIGEARMAGVPEDELLRGGRSARDVGRLLAAFNGELEAEDVSDLADLYAAATEAASADTAPLRSAPLLLLDLSIRTRAEEAFVRSLVVGRDEILATLIAGDDATHRFYGSCELPDVSPGAENAGSSLSRLRAGIFDAGSSDPSPLDETVTFFSAPGEAREAVEIARRIQAEAQRGVPFDEIAVLLRSPRKYMPHVEAAFRRAGIPYFPARSVVRPDPSGRAFLALLACAAEDYSARRFAEYVSLGQVPREPTPVDDAWTPPDDDALYVPTSEERSNDVEEEADEGEQLRAPWRWEEMLVEAAVIGGADRWERRLRGLAEEFIVNRERLQRDEPGSPRIEGLENDLARLRELAVFATPLIRQLEMLRTCTTWGEWLVQLKTIARVALRKPRRVLGILAELEPMARVGPVSIADVQSVLGQRLLTVPRRQPPDRYGRVFIGALDDARGRVFRVVLVPGLAERSFPQKQNEDPMLLDVVRQQLQTRLRVLDDRVEDERLLLRIAIGAASERVVFSYPRFEIAEARPRVPSFYALDIIRAGTGAIPSPSELERMARSVTNARLAWPAPEDASVAIDAAEHDLAVLYPLVRSDPAAVEGRAQYLLELNDALGRSLRSRELRWVNRNWNGADGLARVRQEVKTKLEAHGLKARAYSASSLQEYARCPYSFFLAAVQRLRPRPTIEPVERLDAMTRGTLVHAIYAGVGVELRGAGMFPLAADTLPRARAIADATIDRIASEYHDRLAPAIERVWRDQIDLIRADTYHWLRALAADAQWTPRNFELSFGLTPLDDAEPGSVADPVTLAEGWMLHGSIDLVEEDADRARLRVTDYKTGRAPAPATLVVGQGGTLQPLIYARVAESILGRQVAETRLFYATSRGAFAIRPVLLSPYNRSRLDVVLAEIDDAIATPRLLPIPREDACTTCDFLAVCGPYEESRARDHKEQELAQHVNTIRGMA